MSGKLQILWDRAPTETVLCIQQDMWRMWEDQPLQDSVHVSLEVADGAETTGLWQVSS